MSHTIEPFPGCMRWITLGRREVPFVEGIARGVRRRVEEIAAEVGAVRSCARAAQCVFSQVASGGLS